MGLGRPLPRMLAQPGLDIGARRHHPHSLLPGVGQGRPHQRVADAAPLSGRRHLGVLEVEDVIAEWRVDELRVSVGEGKEESGMVGVVPNGLAGPRRRIVSHEEPNPLSPRRSGVLVKRDTAATKGGGNDRR